MSLVLLRMETKARLERENVFEIVNRETKSNAN